MPPHANLPKGDHSLKLKNQARRELFKWATKRPTIILIKVSSSSAESYDGSYDHHMLHTALSWDSQENGQENLGAEVPTLFQYASSFKMTKSKCSTSSQQLRTTVLTSPEMWQVSPPLCRTMNLNTHYSKSPGVQGETGKCYGKAQPKT